jgi:hypothetical protein
MRYSGKSACGDCANLTRILAADDHPEQVREWKRARYREWLKGNAAGK